MGPLRTSANAHTTSARRTDSELLPRRPSTRITDGVEMRHTNSDRTADGYYGNMDGASPGEKRTKMRNLRIRAVQESAQAQCFPSILHAGLADAEDSPETIRNFENSGGYE
jgi:hypothetical protein